MRLSLSISFVAVLLSAWIALPFSAAAQDIYEEDRPFWDSYKKAQELEDEKEISRLVKRHKKNAEGVLESLTIRLCREEKSQDLDDFEMLAGLLESLMGDRRYAFRLTFIKSLTMEQRGKRIEGFNNYFYGYTKYKEGKTQDNVYILADAKELLGKSFAALLEINDAELMVEVAGRLVECLQTLEDNYEACVVLTAAKLAMEELPYEHVNKTWIESELQKYLEKGYDPTKPKDQGGAPPDDLTKPGEDGGAAAEEEKRTEFSFKLTGEKTTWDLKYYEMKKPDEFVTPTYHPGDQPILWHYCNVQADDQGKYDLQKVTLYGCPIIVNGKQLNVLREGVKCHFDFDAVEASKTTVTLQQKPCKLSMTTGDKAPKGKPLKYQLFVATPGSQEVIFTLNTNLAGNQWWMYIRARNGCYTKGKVAGQNFILIDDNTTGKYGDPLQYPEDGYTKGGDFPYYSTDAVLVGKSKKAVPFSQFMKIGETYHKVEADLNHGQVLTTYEAEVPTGTVLVNWKGGVKPQYVVIHGLDRAGIFNYYDVIGGGRKPVDVPAGKYEIACGKIVTGKKSKLQQVRLYRGNSKPFYVEPGQETVLELGAPFTYEWEGRRVGKTYSITGETVNVFGKSGELYTMFFDNVPIPVVSVRAKDSQRILVKGEKMGKATLDDFNKATMSVWHPLSYKYEGKKSQDMEARLELKKHKILGGPIVGEWR